MYIEENKDYDELINEISMNEGKLEDYLKVRRLKRGDIAFVTFKSTVESDDMVEANVHNKLDRVFGRSRLEYKKIPVFVERAPEAEDIIWENLTYKFWAKARRVLITWAVTIFILALCFFINGTLTLYMRTIRDQMEGDDDGQGGILNPLFLITIISSLVILIMNKLLAIFIVFFTKLEKHHTNTEYEISTAFKLAIATFINSALIPLFINSSRDEYFSQGIYIYIIYI